MTVAPPTMIVVGGPPGSGKSTAMPARTFGVDAFNVDDRCRELHGSYQGIPPEVRARASGECESFVADHLARGVSFAVESTMRTTISIEQAREANARGFITVLLFLCAEEVSIHVERVRARALAGGHSAPEAEIRATYAASLANLSLAVGVFAVIECFDTTPHGLGARHVASVRGGRMELTSTPTPRWLLQPPR
ncbi:MAG: zeta toxin family protein [Deltaproteobacteria bacterium]|jgi:predicted ABC-type ATPase|nr:zeta toxin family protein [Deltaproteobacteria bacterium]MBP6833118.1 zeta toxin family protein [Deltaproteobacteria bacterium]